MRNRVEYGGTGRDLAGSGYRSGPADGYKEWRHSKQEETQ